MVCLSMTAYTQTFTWGAAKNLSCCSSVNGFAFDNSGNMFVAGTFYGDNYVGPYYITSSTPYKYNSFIAKTNKKGKVIWVKVIGSNESSTVQRIAADNSGNIFITGYFVTDLVYEGNTVLSSGGNDAFIMKIDNSGTLQWWDHTIGTSSEFFYDVAVNSSGDAYVTGKFAGSMNIQGMYYFGSPESVTDMLVVKYNGSTGAYIWARQTNSQFGGNSSGSRIAVDNLGGTYVLGNFGTGYTTFGDYTIYGTFNDYFVSKFDEISNFTYTNDIGDIPNGYISNIDADASGNVYMAGNFGMFSPYTATISGTTITSPGNSEIFTAKYNSDFTLQWLKTGGGVTTGDFSNDMSVSNDGDVYVAFTCGASVNFGAVSASSAHPGANDIGVVKYNTSGTEQWASVSGGSNYDAVSLIDLYEAGHFAAISGIGGNNMFFGSVKVKNPNLYIAKLGDVAMRLNGNETETAADILIYPNPASGNLHIASIPENSMVQIISISGNILYSSVAESNYAEINVSEFAAGIYFVRITNNNDRFIQKIIIQ